MRASGANGDFYLAKLAELSVGLKQEVAGTASFFAGPLRIVQETMGFTLSVLYRVANLLDRTLVLEVEEVFDPFGRRPGIIRGARLALDLHDPDPLFRNEAAAFLKRGVAAVNIPGAGCDIAGHIAAGETAADAYLLAGDYVGAEADLRELDIRVFEIATGLLSALLLKAHFQQRADHDRLTGLMSSARIRAELAEALKRHSVLPGRALTVALADVDHFKRINDEHGHLRGDAVLEELGRLIATDLRSGRDYAGRFGGEEFLIILEDTPSAPAHVILEGLRAAVEARPLAVAAPVGGAPIANTIPVTLSIGACVLEDTAIGTDTTRVLAAADRALYAAKAAGRNRLMFVSVQPDSDRTMLHAPAPPPPAAHHGEAC